MFESFWLWLEGFEDVVRPAMDSASAESNALSTLHFKLKAIAGALKACGQHRVSELRQQLAVAHEIILQLNGEMDSR